MMHILQVAFKNLFENKVKTLITMGLIGLGTVLIILGLALVASAMEKTKMVSINDFSGDVLITGLSQKKGATVSLTGVSQTVSVGNMPKMPYLQNSAMIKQKLSTMPQVLATAKSVTVFGMYKPNNLPDNWKPKNGNPSMMNVWSNVLGIDVEEYTQAFNTIRVYDGAMPKASDSSYMLMSRELKSKFEKYYERTLSVGDAILASSWSTRKQAEVHIIGFFDFAHPESSIKSISYMDSNSVRVIANMTKGAQLASTIPDTVDINLSNLDEDELFANSDTTSYVEKLTSTSSAKNTMKNVDSILGDTSLRDELNLPDNEAWHHIAVKLKNHGDADRTIKELTDFFKEKDISAQALSWKKAMAEYTSPIEMTNVLFITALVILSVVVLIVIMNTLLVSVMERTSEIGTMRALGTSRGIIKKMFFVESLFLSLTGAFIGSVLAIAIALILNAINIKVGGGFATMIGGSHLTFILQPMYIFATIVAMALAGSLANIFPVSVAIKISPLAAMNTN